MTNPGHRNTRRLAAAVAVAVVDGVVDGVVVDGVGVVFAEALQTRRFGGWVVQGAGRLLPATARETYVEEWRGWLHDLRADSVPRWRRLLELLSIVLAAPRLAVTLRLAGQRAVD